ncbi:hypothetical protein ACGFZH_16245 [Streptomyces zaomyceticus]|uniref:hypothetical protein n=1 Tax=Streptomyces zaomyceticus TaxID=68286 RepID=UPI0037108ECC
MPADIHHRLHRPHATELQRPHATEPHRAAAATAPRTPGTDLRVQLGRRPVESGLLLATPAHHRPVTLAA